MRRLVVALSVFAVLVVALAIAWYSTGWPALCMAHGWCDPGGILAHAIEHK